MYFQKGISIKNINHKTVFSVLFNMFFFSDMALQPSKIKLNRKSASPTENQICRLILTVDSQRKLSFMICDKKRTGWPYKD